MPKGPFIYQELVFCFLLSSHIPTFFPFTSFPFSASSSCGEGSAQKVGTGADFGIRRSYCKVQLQWGYASRNVLQEGKPSHPCFGLCWVALFSWQVAWQGSNPLKMYQSKVHEGHNWIILKINPRLVSSFNYIEFTGYRQYFWNLTHLL